MKIEVSYNDIESLKSQLQYALQERDEAIKKLAKFSERDKEAEVKRRAVEMAAKIHVFIGKELGFDDTNEYYFDVGNMARYVHEEWYEGKTGRYEPRVVCGQKITNRYKQFFVELQPIEIQK